MITTIGNLIDLSSDILVELDNNFNIKLCNAKFKDYFGDITNFFSIFPLAYREVILRLIENAQKTLTPLNIRIPILRGEKQEIVYMKVFPVEKGLFISIRPQKSSSISEDIINSIDYGVILISKEGNLIYNNNYAKNYEEYWNELIKESLKQQDRNFEVNVKGKTFEVFQKEFERKISGKILLFRDITQIKRMHDLMSLVDRLSSVGLIAASLAHEIKNPLTSIKVLSQVLANDLSNDKKEIALRISRQIDRVNELISKLLIYTKPSKSKPVYVNPTEIINELEGIIYGQLISKKIRLYKDIDTNVEIFVDPKDLHQILLNLVLNSIDALSEGGYIKIEAGISGIVSTELEPLAYIKVIDNGCGIPREKLKEIFYPFYTTKKSGTGLGLFVVHKLVKDNGGMIEVESEVGQGTTFTIYFKGRVKNAKNNDSR
ncbi:MAG: ATP-binding protein [candidate division WOR-3 bacterium]|nr:ATP-binding protein [candidate division WOR-3 bacterium]MCX7946993.1 ATP-binding protein [candidate division WOR-3 bacterium]MDW8149966.1 ATP-binding protein [candidate division WOR-3 bacterium]